MNEETRAQELMIAAIYGELSPDEEREFEGLIESDAAFRAEFEELSETRTVLEKWDVSAPTTGFVFVNPAETTPTRKPGGLRDRLAGLQDQDRVGPEPQPVQKALDGGAFRRFGNRRKACSACGG